MLNSLIEGLLNNADRKRPISIEDSFDELVIRGTDGCIFRTFLFGHVLVKYVKPVDMIDMNTEKLQKAIFDQIANELDDYTSDYGDEDGTSKLTMVVPDDVYNNPILNPIFTVGCDSIEEYALPKYADNFLKFSELGIKDESRFLPNAISSYLKLRSKRALRTLLSRTFFGHTANISSGYDNQCIIMYKLAHQDMNEGETVLEYIERNREKLVANGILNPLYKEWLPKSFKEPDYKPYTDPTIRSPFGWRRGRYL